MDKDRLEGKAKDIAGRVERQVGEWTGNKDAQAEGTGKQAEGKVQNTFGKAKDALRNVGEKARENARDNATPVDEKDDAA
ncbi:MAG TPA: CsbD family protein [Candidatus Acidoferrales bacterium]|nr:CsbD family protein [Candidatus Acidoferrales bacterium]